MICPECRSEYRQGFSTCADCGVELVPSLPKNPVPPAVHGSGHEYADFVDVISTQDHGLVSLLRSVLVAEGIGHYVLGDHAISVFGLPEPMVIRVREDQAERAFELLDELENDSSEDQE
jgi:hypothetical protein